MNGWFVLLVLLVTLPGARPTQMQAGEPRARLAEAQKTWEASKPRSYEFTIEVRCFCVGISKTPPSFRVVDGSPSPLGELDPEGQHFYKTRNTIEKLFAAIDRSLPPYGETESTVQYDGALGFPQVADLDPQRESIDDELYFRVTGFRVIEK
ncbi:MAG: DUF6174 domain-containing protein [Vicinamibacterales bacterium]